ncbi:MAG: hypothetical protein SOT71_09415 [Romboutsia timonensis]|uniref:hypothetical protein n=1 Tax=Romboutsia timonensis TaxID=1776391 RepID=UPI002A74EA96|nr:hypothetical protein [Romboutsia timonensis]MDY2882855.1 hypothetical protein [Romboutsia timonensis]
MEKERSTNNFFKRYGIILLLVIVTCTLPFVVTVLTSCWSSPIPEFETSNDWIGFFGSYMGAILGAIITLIVMYKSIKAGEENLKENIYENQRIQNQNKAIEFCDKVTDLIGEYCSDISVYYYECIKVEYYNIDIKCLNREYDNGSITHEQYEQRLSILDAKKPNADRRKSTAIYFKLDILLKDEEKAKLLLDILSKLHNTYDYVNYKLSSNESKFESDIEELLQETRIFIKEYKKEYEFKN